MQNPLTNLQIWGLPDEEMPEDKKDYFDETQEEADKRKPPVAGPGEEASG